MRATASWVAAVAVLASSAPARAYDVEAHYAWTYYLALHVGYTPRQAFQVASATVGIDGDVDTEPLEGVGPAHVVFGASRREVFLLYRAGRVELAPNLRIVNVWSRLHAFAENRLVGSARTLPVSAPSEAEIARVPDVQATREANQRALWELARTERNPGPFLHFLQDSFAHGPYDNLRGHALHGHAPDFLSHRPSLSWQMTQRTVTALRDFLPIVGGRPRAPNMVRIREVFDRMIAANPRRWAADPALYDTLFDRLMVDPSRYVLDAQALFPSVAGVGSPSAAAAWGVVSRAVDEDRSSGKLPAFPEMWFSERPPSQWLQYDFLGDGRASPGGVNVNRYAVERVAFTMTEPTVTFRPVAGSSSGAQHVTLRVSYTLQGLANLPFLSPLPVVEQAELSDFGAVRNQTLERSNGTFTIERNVQRSAAALQSGTLRWTVKVHPFGLAPLTKDLTVRMTPVAAPQPAVGQCAAALGAWRWMIGTATFSGDASGGAASATGNPHITSGRWRCTGPDQIEVSWNDGRFIDRMRIAGGVMTGTNQFGNPLRAPRADGATPAPAPARPPAPALPETCTWHAGGTFFPSKCICRRSDGISFERPFSRCGR